MKTYVLNYRISGVHKYIEKYILNTHESTFKPDTFPVGMSVIHISQGSVRLIQGHASPWKNVHLWSAAKSGTISHIRHMRNSQKTNHSCARESGSPMPNAGAHSETCQCTNKDKCLTSDTGCVSGPAAYGQGYKWGGGGRVASLPA